MNYRGLVFSMAFASLSLVGLAQTCSQFRLDEVKLLPSRFQENMKRDSAWIASIDVNRLLHSFRNNAGVFTSKEGGYMTVKKPGGWESLDCDLRGHITGHLLSAMANLQMKAKADSLVQGLAEVQRQYGTGYLSAFGEGLIDRNIQGKSVWAPFYTLHKIVQGLIDQYTLCGNATALEVAKGMGQWAYNKLTPLDDATRRRMIRNEFGGFNEAMYNLYAIGEIAVCKREMKHRILKPVFFKFINGKSLEQIFLSQEIVLQCGYEQALPESPRATQKINLTSLDKLVNQVCLVNIYVSVLDNLLKSLYSYWVSHKLHI